MEQLSKSVLGTLAYYDIFEHPLTTVEIYRYLINPARFGNNIGSEIKLARLTDELVKLQKQERIEESNGFYSLPNRSAGLCVMRTEREKIATVKFKKLITKAGWFQAVPYLRGIFVSGSLAISNSNPKSDFDVLVVMRSGRLYTARLILSVLASLLRVRRGRYDKEAPDKFCFNHYITDDMPAIPHRSIYTAYNYSQLIPILSFEDTARKFFSSNIWLNQYLYNFRPVLPSGIRRVRLSGFMQKIRLVLENLLNGKAGDALERMARTYQQRRIRLNPVTNQPGGRTVFTDQQLEFHPHSFEGTVIRRYNETLKKIGVMMPAPEPDSGLSGVKVV